jgi:hypothetical protein
MSTNRQSTSGQRPGFEPLEARCLLSRIELPPFIVPVHPPMVDLLIRISPQDHGLQSTEMASSTAPQIPRGLSTDPQVAMNPSWAEQTGIGPSMYPPMHLGMHTAMISVILPSVPTSTSPDTAAQASPDTAVQASPDTAAQASSNPEVQASSNPATAPSADHLRFDHDPHAAFVVVHPGPPPPPPIATDLTVQIATRPRPRVEGTTSSSTDSASSADPTEAAEPVPAATSPVAQAPAVPAMPSAVSDEVTLARPLSATPATLATVPMHSVVPAQPSEMGPSPTVTPTHEKGATHAAPGSATPGAAATAEEEALEGLETPTPQSAGLIAEVATLDGAAIEATVTRLLDRFRDLATPLESPAPGVPSPLMVAAAVASIECSRRWIARRRRGGITITVHREDRLALHGFS